MVRRLLGLSFVLVTMVAAAPAAAQPQTSASAQSITASGTGQALVRPRNRHSNASIVAAVDAARKAAIPSALAQAHEYALDYAAAVGMTLGSVMSVSDSQSGPGYFFGPGPFGPNQYCGTAQQPVGKPVKGKKPKFKKVRRCIVPRFEFLTLTVTYAATATG
jgi:uncharacterized protein YggE